MIPTRTPTIARIAYVRSMISLYTMGGTIQLEWIWVCNGKAGVKHLHILPLAFIYSVMDKISQYVSPKRIDWSEFLRLQKETSMEGSWKLNTMRSQSVDSALRAFHVPWWIRKCVPFLRTMDIRFKDDAFRWSMGCSGFHVSETYSLDGRETRTSRRDRRRGTQLISAQGTKERVVVCSSWDAPHEGACIETYELESRDTLLVKKEWSVKETGEIIRVKQVYDRSY